MKKAKNILAYLLAVAFGVLIFMPSTAHALTSVTDFTEVISSGYSTQNNAVVTENNDIYLLYNNNKLIKYTYSTGTWGSPVTVKVGGSNKTGDTYSHFIYKDGVFHLLYGADAGTIYYTYSTDPANFPVAVSLGNVSNIEKSAVINIRNDGKVAVFVGSTSDRRGRVYSNYGGSFTTTNLSQYGSEMSYHGVYFSDDNTITAYRYWDPDGSHEIMEYTDIYTWNGSAWTGSPSTTYSSSQSSWILFPYAKYKWLPDDSWSGAYYYTPTHAEKAGSALFRASYGSGSYNYLRFHYGNFIYSVARANSYDRSSLIKKFNSPDGRIIIFKRHGTSGSNKLSVMFADYFTPQPLSAAGNSADSISVQHTQGDNPSFITTYVRASLNSNMSPILQTKTVANSGNASTTYTTDFTGLLPSTRYYFRSEVNDGLGRIKYSSVISRCTIPSVPTNIAFSNIGSKSMTISWNTNQNGTGTRYYIERSLSGNPSGTDWVVVYSGTDPYYTDEGLTAKTTYYYRVRAQNLDNEYGSYSTTSSQITLDVDIVAPTVALTVNNGEAVLYDSALPVKIVAGDNRTAANILTYSYTINGASWTTPASIGAISGIVSLNVSHGLATSGDINFQLRVTDEDGNVGIASSKVYYQKPSELPAAPENAVLSMPETGTALTPGTLNGTNVLFSGKGTFRLNMSAEAAPKYQVSINNQDYGPLYSKTSATDYNLGMEGLHTVRVRQVNSAGIAGAEKEYKIVVDKTPPDITVGTATGARATRNASITLIVTATDNISTTLYCSINGDAWAALPADGRVSASLAVGLNNLVVRVKDEAGNIAQDTIKIWRI